MVNYLSLYRKYRPVFFSEILGQNNIVLSLKNSIFNKNFSHAYIFSGSRGTGKTSIAKIFSRTINCENITKEIEACKKCLSCNENFKKTTLDIIEIDAASNNGVDEIRNLQEKIKLLPTISKYKIYIIDEVHMFTKSAFNALLKTLEEPPKHIIFILATTNVSKIPPTIISRCQFFNFSLISEKNIVKNLENILLKENIFYEKEVLQQISHLAEGSMRDSLSILERLISLNSKEINSKMIESTFKILSLLDKNNFIDSYINENKKNILDIKNKIIYGSLDIDLFLNEIIKLIKIRCENIIFNKNNDKNFNKYIKFIDLILNYYMMCENIKNKNTSFEIFILKLISYFNNNEYNKFVLDEKKDKKSQINQEKSEKHDQHKVIISWKDFQLKKDNKINNNNYDEKKFYASINEKYAFLIISQKKDKEYTKKINEMIKQKTNNKFDYFYGGIIRYANEKGIIINFNKIGYSNYLNLSLNNEIIRENILKSLRVNSDFLIMSMNDDEFSHFKEKIQIIKQLFQDKKEEFDVKKYYNSLYSNNKKSSDNDKIREIFGNDIIIN